MTIKPKTPPIPTKKSAAIESLLDKLVPNPLGRRGSIEGAVCVWCEGPAEEFTDELSLKEYQISGLCQACQNKTLGSPV